MFKKRINDQEKNKYGEPLEVVGDIVLNLA